MAHSEYLIIFHKAVMKHWSNEPREEEIHEKDEEAKDEGEDPSEEGEIPRPMKPRDHEHSAVVSCAASS